MVSITGAIIFSLFMFCFGVWAGRKQGKAKCVKHMQAILEEYGFKQDENIGDA